ncbi:Actin- protein 10 [Blomia tropicalis]|nr:Actin- protein 10 [Blomia tropicalis]
MPIYEGMTDKSTVVLEIGSSFTKCGFASEYSPRAIFPSRVFLPSINKHVNIIDIQDEEELSIALKDFLQLIYFKYLAANPKDRRVVIVETIFSSNQFRKKLVDVLFKQFDVPSILVVAHHVVVLCTLGINTGLILDIGYKEATVIPIVDAVTLLDSVQFAPLGGKSIHYRIMDEIIQRKAEVKDGDQMKHVETRLEESILEDIKIKTCFVTTIERGSILAQQKLNEQTSLKVDCSITKPPPAVRFPIGGNKILKIPGSLRESVCEVLFEMYGEEHTLPTLIIDAILSCPVDCRRQLASNIVLIGGTAMLPGFKHRLFKEIKHLTTNSKRYKQLSFANDFKFHKLPCKENYACWLGASIFATNDLLSMRSLTCEQYLRNNETIKDWSNYWNPGL